MDEDFNWFVVHVFDDTVGHSPCVTWQILCFCSGCFVWALAPFLCFASLFSLDGETQIWRGDLRVVFWFWCFLLCLCDPICQVPDETTVFHAEFFNSFACLSQC